MQPASNSEFKPKAVFTFFSLSNCGYCKVFKGEKKDKNDQIYIDPTSGWETLRNDPDLYKAGIQFVLYQVGDVKDPATGKVKRYQLEPEYKGIRGFPHLRLTRPDDRFNGVPFDGRITGWAAEQSVPGIKSWILQKLQESPFKDYQVSNTSFGNRPSQSQSVQANPNPAYRSPDPDVPQNQVRAENGTMQKGQSIVRHHVRQEGEPAAVPAIPPNYGDRQEVSARPAATVFGLGTRKVAVVPNEANPRVAEPKRVTRPAPRFIPVNADD